MSLNFNNDWRGSNEIKSTITPVTTSSYGNCDSDCNEDCNYDCNYGCDSQSSWLAWKITSHPLMTQNNTKTHSYAPLKFIHYGIKNIDKPTYSWRTKNLGDVALKLLTQAWKLLVT